MSFYRIVFTKITPEEKNGIWGKNIEKISCFTSSSVKKNDYIDLYTSKGYGIVVSEQLNFEIPNGFETKNIKTQFWHPSLDIPNLQFKNPEEAKEVIKTGKINTSYVCPHKFNCSAHKEVCVKEYGLQPITTTI